MVITQTQADFQITVGIQPAAQNPKRFCVLQ